MKKNKKDEKTNIKKVKTLIMMQTIWIILAERDEINTLN